MGDSIWSEKEEGGRVGGKQGEGSEEELGGVEEERGGVEEEEGRVGGRRRRWERGERRKEQGRGGGREGKEEDWGESEGEGGGAVVVMQRAWEGEGGR